jgi:hypothetical protein
MPSKLCVNIGKLLQQQWERLKMSCAQQQHNKLHHKHHTFSPICPPLLFIIHRQLNTS